MAETKREDTATLRKETYLKLVTGITFYIDIVEEATSQLTDAFNEANLEHDIRFRLNDVRANGLILRKLVEEAEQEVSNR